MPTRIFSDRLPAAGRPALGALALLVGCYVVAHGLLLVDPGIFWDDWVLFRQPSAVLYQMYDRNGVAIYYYFMEPLLALPGWWPNYAMNALTFGLYLASGLLLWRVLRRCGALTEAEALGLALLMLVLPLNLARNPMINFPYAVAQAALCAGYAVFQAAEQRERPSWLGRLLAATLFSFGFTISSLLFVYLPVPLYAAWRRWPASGSLVARAVRAVRASLGWWLLPLLFWFGIRNVFLKPAPGYNEIHTGNLGRLPLDEVRTFYFSLVKPVLVSLTALRPGLASLLALVGLALVALVARRTGAVLRAAPRVPPLLGMLVGAAFFASCAFPYLMVGKMPTLAEFSSRHQIVLVPGAALMIYYGLALVSSLLGAYASTGRRAGLALLVIAFCAYDIRTYLQYERDWLKQRALMAQMPAVPALRSEHTFLVDDQTRFRDNVFDREVRFYEYAGMFKQVFGDQTRFAAWPQDWALLAKILPIDNRLYLLHVTGEDLHKSRDWRPAPVTSQLTIAPGSPLSDGQVLWETLTDGVPDSVVTATVHLQADPLPVGTPNPLPAGALGASQH